MAKNIQIVHFDTRYQDATANLINAGLGEHFGFIDESMNPDLYDIASNYEQGDFLLAMHGAIVVGTGALMPRLPGRAQIVRMHTAFEYRRQGIASRLLDSLESRAIRANLRSLFLETNTDWTDAIAFYTSRGYQEISRNDVEVYFEKNRSRILASGTLSVR